MQLQPKTLSIFSLRAPEYQYKPRNEQKIQEKECLEMYYKDSPDASFVQLVEVIFSDRYLYENKGFRTKVTSNKKGFVDIDLVLKEQLIDNFIKQMGQKRPNNQSILLLIQKLSAKLICNKRQIRRRQPFINRIKHAKPLYIQQYPQNDGNQQLQTLLQNTTTIYKTKYRHSQNWGVVYAQDPDKVVKLNGHFWSIKTYFRVMNYEKSKQTFQTPIFFGALDLIKIYQHSIFDRGRLCQKEKQLSYHQHQYGEMDTEQHQAFQRFQWARRQNKGESVPNCEQKEEKNQKIQRKINYLHPNSIFNSQHLDLTLLNKQIMPQKHNLGRSRLTVQQQSQIDGILMKFFQQTKMNASQNKPSQINEFETQSHNIMELE